MSESEQLSRLLFEAREVVDMYFDVVKARTGKEDAWLVRVRDDIDTYRAEQGWSPHGFGGETPTIYPAGSRRPGIYLAPEDQ